MAKTEHQIIADIEAHIVKCGGRFGHGYVGITTDPRERLFDDHSVRDNGDASLETSPSSHPIGELTV